MSEKLYSSKRGERVGVDQTPTVALRNRPMQPIVVTSYFCSVVTLTGYFCSVETAHILLPLLSRTPF